MRGIGLAFAAAFVLAGTGLASFAQPMMNGSSPWRAWRDAGPWHMWWGMKMGPRPRHELAMTSGIPEPYRSMTNPLPRTRQTVEHGADIFRANCAACHGDTGRGDGPQGMKLSPPPANLAWLSRMPISSWDPFMVWTVSEGGAPLGTAMPSFKGTLSNDDIWSVIAYIQAELPPAGKSK